MVGSRWRLGKMPATGNYCDKPGYHHRNYTGVPISNGLRADVGCSRPAHSCARADGSRRRSAYDLLLAAMSVVMDIKTRHECTFVGICPVLRGELFSLHLIFSPGTELKSTTKPAAQSNLSPTQHPPSVQKDRKRRTATARHTFHCLSHLRNSLVLL